MSVFRKPPDHAETAGPFLTRAFMADDRVAVLLKAYDTGRALQRVAPVGRFGETRWLN